MVQIDSRVVVLTVTYGNRWNFLLHVIEAVMREESVTHLVIVDNGSKNKEAIEQGVKQYGNKVTVLRQEKNLGSAGGFAVGLEYVRGLEYEYVFILDDDNVPEVGATTLFLKSLQELGKEKVVLIGNRVNLPGNEEVFYSNSPKVTESKGTFFENFSFKKVAHFFSLLRGQSSSRTHTKKQPLQFVPNESFVYSGAFIPIEAIREAPLPDRELVLYGDDIEYSWGIKRLGYESYVCYSPKIYDLEISFGEESQAVGLYNPATPLFKLYYRIRNMVRISIRNTKQNQIVLFINIFLWITALSVLGLRYGLHKDYFRRWKLAILAVYGGYMTHASVPKEAILP